MNSLKMGMLGLATAAFAATTWAATPTVQDVTVSQTGSDVVIAYALSSEAVVTFDVETNCVATGEWVSVGGRNLWSVSPDSDVFRKVTGKDACRIVWRPEMNLSADDFAAQTARAVVTAWPTDDTPDYLVADMTAGGKPADTRYYPSVDYLPGGLLENEAYRQTLVVMKKVVAKGVPWVMGCFMEDGRIATSGFEDAHPVTLTNNYYLGIFPVTRFQYACIGTDYQYYVNPLDRGMRPADRISYNELFSSSYSNVEEYLWPNDPLATSPLGKLRARTGLDFTLPSEAEWEFACRAGTGERQWNDGSAYLDKTTDANLPGRYKNNGGYVNGTTAPTVGCDPSQGTSVVGSYAPNRWGFYDMHGNMYEWCLDWGEYDITRFDGRPNIDPAHPLRSLSGTEMTKSRIVRGGSFAWPSANCRSASRNWLNCLASRGDFAPPNLVGFRLCCRAGLK